MNWKNWIPKPRTAGIDIGKRTLKGIQLKRKGGRIHLDRFFFVDLLKEGLLPETPNSLFDPTETLAALVQIHKMKGTRCSTALREEQVHTFELTLPEMPESDLKSAIQGEVSTLFGKSAEDLVIDYTATGPSAQADIDRALTEAQTAEGDSAKALKYQAFASLKADVKEHMRVLTQSGLRPYSIESESQAEIAALRFNEYIQDTTNCLVISVGDSHTAVIFVVNGEVVKTQQGKIGLGDVNQRLQERLGLSAENAETKKRAYQFSEDADRSAIEEEIIEESIFEISKFVKESLESFQEAWLGVKLEKAYLIGGGSQLQKFDRALESFFGLPTEIPNPFKNIELYSGKNDNERAILAEASGQFFAVVGLALRNLEAT